MTPARMRAAAADLGRLDTLINGVELEPAL